MYRPDAALKIVCESTGECLAYLTPNRTGEDEYHTYFFTYKGCTTGPIGCKDAIIEISQEKFIEDDEYDNVTNTHTIIIKDIECL